MNYSDSFTEQREKNYCQAMQLWPNARNQEFANLFKFCNSMLALRVLDIPAMAGYLGPFLPAGSTVKEVNFNGYFAGGRTVPPTHAQWALGKFDLVACNAVMHHIGDKFNFLSNLAQCATAPGEIVVSDPKRGSKVAAFLDKNIKNHNGKYTNWAKQKLPNNVKLKKLATLSCPWIFDSMQDMVVFCKLLFSCQSMSAELLESEVGVERVNQRLHLNWELEYAWLEKS